MAQVESMPDQQSLRSVFVESITDQLPSRSPFVGFLRHSPHQTMQEQFHNITAWRSRCSSTACGDAALEDTWTEKQDLQLPKTSPYVGSQRHAPPSPFLAFASTWLPPPAFELDEISDEEPETSSLSSAAGSRLPGESPNQVPEDVWHSVLSFVAETPMILRLAPVARGVYTLLKSEVVWADHAVRISPGMVEGLAPNLDAWLPVWRLASKLIVPRSIQLLEELQERTNLHIEVAWRFDKELKGRGVDVINHGGSVKRIADAEEELVVLGDAPLIMHEEAHYFEVSLDDRTADTAMGNLNDFGIGVTARPPSLVAEVASEVPMSWVVDFTRSSVVLSVNNREAAKGENASAEDLEEGDKVGLRVTPCGSFEIFINGELRQKLVLKMSDRVPRGIKLFPVLDLYGCTAQLSRTDSDSPSH